jgi:phage-related protein
LTVCAIFGTIRYGLIAGMKKIVGRFYASANGNRPVRDWLLELTRDDRRTIGADIQRVEFGWPLGMPYCRSLGHGLWEVRSHLSGGRIARVIFVIVDSEMIMLHGFEKKTRQTPATEIELALRRKREVGI